MAVRLLGVSRRCLVVGLEELLVRVSSLDLVDDNC
jgi:hypothetical protein